MPTAPDNKMVLRYFLFLFAVSILLVGRLFWPFASILIISFLLTNTFRPVFNVIHRSTSASFASLLTCVLIVLLVFVPLVFFTISLSREGVSYLHYIKDINFAIRIKALLRDSSLFAALKTHLQNFGISFQVDDLSRNLTEYARMAGVFAYTKVSGLAANVFTFVVDFALMILVIFFLLMDYDRLVDFVTRLSPMPDDQERRLIDKFQEIAQAILLGNGICGVLQGVLGGALFAYLDIRSPVLWGGIMAIMAFLPIVGIGSVLLPTAGIFLLQGHMETAALVTVFYLVLSMSVEYVLKPKLVGSKVRMHTLLVFLSIIGGLSGFGVLGIIYGPLIVTAFLTMTEIYFESYQPLVTGESGSGDA